MKPSLVYIIGNGTFILFYYFEEMGTWDTCTKYISALASPTIVFKIIVEIELIASFIFGVWDYFMELGFAILYFVEMLGLEMVLTDLLKCIALHILPEEKDLLILDIFD
jgi:hypothetical protein